MNGGLFDDDEFRQAADLRKTVPHLKSPSSGVRHRSQKDFLFPSGGFVYADPAVSRAVAMVRHAVAKSVPILLRGETGTGKEMLAQYAHRLSGRAGRFIAINCAAFPECLIESELFGYREGSFTGARSGGAEGLILQANGGTLLLDEIGDMPLNLQPTLLRFLDNWTIRPIGSNKEVRFDIQLITATNCDLEEAIAEKRFRCDLLHRINKVDISLPRLCERADFAKIVKNILSRLSPQAGIDPEALQLLRAQPWTGNMRELKDFLVRSSLTCAGTCISVEAIEPFLLKRPANKGLEQPESFALLDVRRKAIVDSYHQNGGNISKAAQSLSISRNTVYRELRLAGLIDNASPQPDQKSAQRTRTSLVWLCPSISSAGRSIVPGSTRHLP